MVRPHPIHHHPRTSYTTPQPSKATHPANIKKKVSPHRPSHKLPHPNNQHNHPSKHPHLPPAPLQRRPLSPRSPRHSPRQHHPPRLPGSSFLSIRNPRLRTPPRSPSDRLAPNAGCNEDGVPASGIRYRGAHPPWHGTEARAGWIFPAGRVGRCKGRQCS